MNDYQTLMSALHNAHQDFQKKCQKWKDSDHFKPDKMPVNVQEPMSIALARKNFWDAFNLLFDGRLVPLESRFKINPQSAVDEIIDFLAVDIPAFRCSNYKEFFLKKLQEVKLTPAQEQRIINVFIKLCKTRTMPREFQSWCELVLAFADLDIVDDLMILSRSTNNYTKTKSKLMMEMIFKDRKEVPNYT
ncbi:MAG TPA: hypothetical protein PKY59_13445 [Pyrinomonadaceae bacterium]|nr:hypothetical protein [Pyrinomonadaceae bacterium]